MPAAQAADARAAKSLGRTIAPDELAARVNLGRGALSSDRLARWLVAERLAEVDRDGRLRPTGRGLTLGRGLVEIERDSGR